ncbi:MAG: ribonuclease III, partial [Hyphomicrobiales bacterium]|nr:ribonuclease III [Hyphomicrobiales bacterium]
TRLFDNATARRDSKTELQEWSHSKRLGTPKYKEISRSGPDHDPVFMVAVLIEGLKEAEGTGSSKQAAEQSAAGKMLMREDVWKAKETDK